MQCKLMVSNIKCASKVSNYVKYSACYESTKNYLLQMIFIVFCIDFSKIRAIIYYCLKYNSI